MTDLASSSPLPADALDRIAAAQADWAKRHTRVAVACAGGLFVLSSALLGVLLLGTKDSVSPPSVVFAGVLIGVVASALAAAISNARFAHRSRRLAVSPPPAVECHVERLGADTKLRRDHLHIRLADSSRTILLRVEDDAPLHLLPERGTALLLGTPGRNQPVLVGVQGRPFVAARRA